MKTFWKIGKQRRFLNKTFFWYQTNKDFHQRKIFKSIIFHCRITVAKSGRHYNVAVGKLVNREQINYDEIKIWNEFLSTYNISQIILALVSKVIGPAIKSYFKSCSFEWMKLFITSGMSNLWVPFLKHCSQNYLDPFWTLCLDTQSVTHILLFTAISLL